MNRATILVSMLLLVVFPIACSDDNPVVVDHKPKEEEPVNHPPVFLSQPDTFVWMGDTLELIAKATDSDQDQLAYFLVDYYSSPCPEIDATIDSITGLFHFTPKVSDVPSRTFGFAVDDGNGGCDTTYFDVIIYEDTGLEIMIFPGYVGGVFALYIDDVFINLMEAGVPKFIELEPGTYKVFVRYSLPCPYPDQWTKYVNVIDKRTTRLILN